MPSKTKCFGILTSGGDCPGLNAAIRGVTKAAFNLNIGIEIIGIADGYRGLMENTTRLLQAADVSGILTTGGTILGTSREKPFKWSEKDAVVGGKQADKVCETYQRLGLDCLVVLGGNGTHKTAYQLQQLGLNVIGLPKTIDNDIWGTELSFGFLSAVSIATDAIDRLHSTASSHNRVMVIEVMGHKAGWLALNSGVAGGGDIILLPEIPYDMDAINQHLITRSRRGKDFSIVVVAEGAMDTATALLDKTERKKAMKDVLKTYPTIGYKVASEIQEATNMETRVTVLGYQQRGGAPSAYDRLLATQFGTAAAELLFDGNYGKMVALEGSEIIAKDLVEIAGKTKLVPADHRLVQSAKAVGTCFGDEA